jgi:hypothetical protein
MSKKKVITKRKLTWRDTPDSALRAFITRPQPESLTPNSGTIERAVAGNPEAMAICSSYRFTFPVTIMTREQLEAL